MSRKTQTYQKDRLDREQKSDFTQVDSKKVVANFLEDLPTLAIPKYDQEYYKKLKTPPTDPQERERYVARMKKLDTLAMIATIIHPVDKSGEPGDNSHLFMARLVALAGQERLQYKNADGQWQSWSATAPLASAFLHGGAINFQHNSSLGLQGLLMKDIGSQSRFSGFSSHCHTYDPQQERIADSKKSGWGTFLEIITLGAYKAGSTDYSYKDIPISVWGAVNPITGENPATDGSRGVAHCVISSERQLGCITVGIETEAPLQTGANGHFHFTSGGDSRSVASTGPKIKPGSEKDAAALLGVQLGQKRDCLEVKVDESTAVKVLGQSDEAIQRYAVGMLLGMKRAVSRTEYQQIVTAVGEKTNPRPELRAEQLKTSAKTLNAARQKAARNTMLIGAGLIVLGIVLSFIPGAQIVGVPLIGWGAKLSVGAATAITLASPGILAAAYGLLRAAYNSVTHSISQWWTLRKLKQEALSNPAESPSQSKTSRASLENFQSKSTSAHTSLSDSGPSTESKYNTQSTVDMRSNSSAPASRIPSTEQLASLSTSESPSSSASNSPREVATRSAQDDKKVDIIMDAVPPAFADASGRHSGSLASNPDSSASSSPRRTPEWVQGDRDDAALPSAHDTHRPDFESKHSRKESESLESDDDRPDFDYESEEEEPSQDDRFLRIDQDEEDENLADKRQQVARSAVIRAGFLGSTNRRTATTANDSTDSTASRTAETNPPKPDSPAPKR